MIETLARIMTSVGICYALLSGCSTPKDTRSAKESKVAPATQPVASAAVAGAAEGRLMAMQIKAAEAARKAPEPQDPDLPAPDSEGYSELDWLKLMPKDELEALKNAPPVLHAGNAQMKQFGSYAIVPQFIGKKVKLPGYVVPMEMDGKGRMTEFFFVPYFGACIHVPPPPPNQMIYVILAKSVKAPEIWEPLWLRGSLTAETLHKGLAGTAYSMAEAELRPYDG